MSNTAPERCQHNDTMVRGDGWIEKCIRCGAFYDNVGKRWLDDTPAPSADPQATSAPRDGVANQQNKDFIDHTGMEVLSRFFSFREIRKLLEQVALRGSAAEGEQDGNLRSEQVGQSVVTPQPDMPAPSAEQFWEDHIDDPLWNITPRTWYNSEVFAIMEAYAQLREQHVSAPLLRQIDGLKSQVEKLDAESANETVRADEAEAKVSELALALKNLLDRTVFFLREDGADPEGEDWLQFKGVITNARAALAKHRSTEEGQQ